jgi:hypothetical protein
MINTGTGLLKGFSTYTFDNTLCIVHCDNNIITDIYTAEDLLETPLMQKNKYPLWYPCLKPYNFAQDVKADCGTMITIPYIAVLLLDRKIPCVWFDIATKLEDHLKTINGKNAEEEDLLFFASKKDAMLARLIYNPISKDNELLERVVSGRS